LLLLTIVVILFLHFEIGVYLTSDTFKDFIFTNFTVLFGVVCFIIAILAIWSECQL
jgi:hypothetical protein